MIIVLAGLFTCTDESYPVYNEGVVLFELNSEPFFFNSEFTEPLVTPDGNSILYIDRYSTNGPKGGLKIRSLISDKERTLTNLGYAADISSDGQWIAYNSSYGVISKIKFNGDSLAVITSSGSGDFNPNFSSEDMSIIYEHHSGGGPDLSGIWRIFMQGNAKEYLVDAGGNPYLFSNNNSVITTKYFANTSGSKFLIHDLETKELISILDPSPGKNNTNPQIDPHGETILYSNDDGIFIRFSNGSRNSILPYKHIYEHRQGDYLGFIAVSPSWHPDGKHIVYQHFAITEHTKCPDNMYCTYSENFKGIASIRLLRIE